MPPTAAALGLNLNTTIGALLLGGLVSAMLYGITSTQTAVYYQREHGDRLLVKGVVLILWLLDSFDMALICHILYWYLINNYGNPLSLAVPVWSIILHVLVTSLTQFVVRAMFAWRVWCFSRGNWIPATVISVVNTAELVTAVVITIKCFHTTFVGLQRLDALVFLEFGTGFSGDCLVALCLCYFLHTSRTGLRRTESMINILMAYVINTGLFTALTSSVSLILFAVKSDNFIYVAVYFQLSKLYVNAYLAMLNARDKIRERSNDVVSIHLSHLSNSRTGAAQSGAASQGVRSGLSFAKDDQMLSIRVDTEINESMDSSSASPSSYRGKDVERSFIP
ncbi:hypothetical protein PsYK624_086420 [Phanerochaete sordida]|uniref:DUF6534 domain-containing protein n=1 Tax=Phanerochaete sordida TaxID=48140 RepID=A0A9P3LFC6_9APHY|nr:hypothetical protein PsYK624_086420 [Phanerochaete sordida]